MASFSVVSNISSQNAQANLSLNQVSLSRTLNRLSSGYRINYSGDDAAGLAVANTYRSDTAVLNQGVRNANDGLSTLQIKDGALNNISNLLDRLSTLATQAASGAFTSNGGKLTTLNDEATKILDEIDRESNVANVATTGAKFSVYVSASTTSTNNVVTGTIDSGKSSDLGLTTSTVDLTSATTAQSAISTIRSAVQKLGDVQAQVGILENRLQFAISLSQSEITNKKAAESRIRDANIAEESANMTRFSILSQSGIASLAQANQQSSAVLSLLRG